MSRILEPNPQASELATRWHKLCRLWYMSIDSGNLHIPIYVCCHQAISKSRMWSLVATHAWHQKKGLGCSTSTVYTSEQLTLRLGICVKYFLLFPQKTCHHRKLRQTKCLLFIFWRKKSTVIPKKDIWLLVIWQNWCLHSVWLGTIWSHLSHEATKFAML